MFTLLPICDR